MNQHQLFRDNRYTKIYWAIMYRAMSRTLEGYSEKHHFIPKALGGTDVGVVRLTAREHFLAHLLLVRMTDGQNRYKMISALWAMCNLKSGSTIGRIIPKSRSYETARKLYAAKLSLEMKGKPKSAEHRKRIGDGNRGKVLTVEQRAKISAAKIGKSLGPMSAMQKAACSAAKTGSLNPAARTCQVDGQQFACMKDATAALGLSKSALRKLPTFFLVNSDGSLDDSCQFKPKVRKPMSDSQREKLRALATGRKLSDAAKAKLSAKLKGRESPRKGKALSEAEKQQKSKPVEVFGVKYYGLTEACNQTGMTAYYLKKDPSFKRLNTLDS